MSGRQKQYDFTNLQLFHEICKNGVKTPYTVYVVISNDYIYENIENCRVFSKINFRISIKTFKQIEPKKSEKIDAV